MPNVTLPLSATGACDTALSLLDRRLWPIPLHPAGAEIRHRGGTRVATGKEPIGRAWGRSRPTEAELVRTFGDHPGAGVGIRLGLEGGVMDLEVDGPEGEDSLHRLIGRRPSTLGWSSRRGPHNLFAFEARFLSLKRGVVKLAEFPGLEIRLGANGSQLQSACPPTVGIDGQARAWNGYDRIARLPETTIERILELGSQREPIAPGEPSARAFVGYGRYGDAALAAECDLVARSVEGSRHATLRSAGLRIAALARSGVLPWEEARLRLADSSRWSGLPDGEIRETLDWAWMHSTPRMTHIALGREDSSLLTRRSRNQRVGGRCSSRMS